MKGLFSILLAVLLIAVLSAIFAIFTAWVWNGTMPELFGLSEIGWWMAFKIQILTALLFKDFSKSSK